MKFSLPHALSLALLLCIPTSHAQTPEPLAQAPHAPAARSTKDVTIRGTIISVPNPEAARFSAKQDLNGKPAEALDALLELTAQQKASSVTNPAVTTRSGQRALTESGQVSFETETVVSPDEKIADVTILVNDKGHKLATSVQVTNEAVKFLGSVTNPTNATMTDYIFVRVSF